MGTERGHLLPYTAFQIGFGEVYDPEIFNSVGPMAVTKAYRRLLATSGAGSRSDRTATRNPREMNLYEQHVLYPFGYKTSGEVFLPTQDPDARLQRITGKSISLHLFGHQTKNLEVDDDSILMAAFKKLSVVDGKTTTDSFYNLVAPRYLGVRFGVSHIEDIRIIAAKSSYKDSSSSVLEVELKTHFGKLRVGGDSNNWAMTLKYVFSSPRHANAVLSKLIYMPRHGNHMEKDVIEIRFSADKDIQIRKVAVYNVEKLVTIIVKTVGRVEKVFALVSSARKLYPGIHIIVSDDAEHLVESGGFKKSFYYMPLPHDAGLSAGRNRMVEQVKTTYFLTLDDDFVLDENSKIEALIHALETPPDVAMREKHAYPNWRGTFDIAAGKNPVDEQRWGLDFSGLMSVEGGVLRLKNGTYGPQPHEGCHHVDFVPNIFLGRTSVFQKEIQWDEQLKLGEHEDFFLRSKELGLGTLTCPHVSFNHDQVHHWLKQTKYDLLRNRVYDFWKLALMKHGARQLESFGNIMMDLIVPPKVKRVITSLVLSQSAIITWDQGKNSNATSYRIMQSFAEGISNENDLTPVNGNEGENFIPSRSRFRTTSILANNLEPGKSYIFRVFAGNRFEFEDDGADLFIKTLTKREEQALNLLKNPSFEEGHFQFNHSVGATFHIVESMYREDLTEYDKQVERNRLSRASRLSRERGRSSAGLAHRYHSFQNDPQSSAFDSNSFPGSAPLGVPEEKRRILIHELCRTGNFCGRAQIPTRSYQSNSMTVNEIVQSVDGQRLQIDGERMLVFTAWSKIERLFHPETSWRAELRVWFNQNPKEKLNDLGWIKAASPHMVEVAYFDTGFQEWQQSLIIMCLSPWATVARVDVVGILETFRGSVYWDDWLLLEKTGSEF
ncbi:hypothetical protein BJ742DRAFT_162782 [Cladochytrium replicatum]|nr:hypothetical protein BJ742DRAFT_162782 [Cladochytrium replicatum]